MRLPKRIILDTEEFITNTLYKTYGIHYSGDLSGGWALIFGPRGSPYEHFPLFFEVKIPETYPYTAPTVRFCTAIGRVKIHPLLDAGQLVEIPEWSASMRLSSILMGIYGLLTYDKPLMSDCAYGVVDDMMNEHYSEYLKYVGWTYMLDILEGERRPMAAKLHLDVLYQHLHEHVDVIPMKICNWTRLPYSMMCRKADYGALKERADKKLMRI